LRSCDSAKRIVHLDQSQIVHVIRVGSATSGTEFDLHLPPEIE